MDASPVVASAFEAFYPGIFAYYKRALYEQGHEPDTFLANFALYVPDARCEGDGYHLSIIDGKNEHGSFVIFHTEGDGFIAFAESVPALDEKVLSALNELCTRACKAWEQLTPQKNSGIALDSAKALLAEETERASEEYGVHRDARKES